MEKDQKQILIKYYDQHYYSHEYNINTGKDDYDSIHYQLAYSENGQWAEQSGVAASMTDTKDGFFISFRRGKSFVLDYDEAMELFCLMLNERDFGVKICKQIKEIEI